MNFRRPGCVSRYCSKKSLCRDCKKSRGGPRCKPKTARCRRTRSGGIYVTLDGNASRGNMILELREILGGEDNRTKEASMREMKEDYPELKLRVHDSVCACQFAAPYVQWMMLDRFHAKNHKRPLCRTKFNPNTPSNCKIRYRYGCANTVACEQLFRNLNQHSTAQQMGKLQYRAFWRHVCLNYNSYVANSTPQSCSLTHPATSRRLTLRKKGLR